MSGRDKSDGGGIVQADGDEYTGQRIGNLYTIARKIAEGGFNKVFLADMDGGERVVIKQITSDNYEYVAKFVREGEVIRRLPHPNIAKVRQIIHDSRNPKTAYQVVEYVEGGTLYDLIYNSGMRFTIWSAAYVIACVAAALGRAHSFNRDGVIHSLLHLDVTPENILISIYGEVKLTDFGIHVLTRPDKGPLILVGNDYIGKAAYMAPEQIPVPDGGPRLIGPWTDFYSLGLVWAEMFLKRPVFSAATTTDELIARARRGYNLDLRKLIADKKDRDLIRETDAMIRVLCADNPEIRPGGGEGADPGYGAKLIISQIERDIQNYRTRGESELKRMAMQTFASRLGFSSAALTSELIEIAKSKQGWKASASPPLRLTLPVSPPDTSEPSNPAPLDALPLTLPVTPLPSILSPAPTQTPEPASPVRAQPSEQPDDSAPTASIDDKEATIRNLSAPAWGALSRQPPMPGVVSGVAVSKPQAQRALTTPGVIVDQMLFEAARSRPAEHHFDPPSQPGPAKTDRVFKRSTQNPFTARRTRRAAWLIPVVFTPILGLGVCLVFMMSHRTHQKDAVATGVALPQTQASPTKPEVQPAANVVQMPAPPTQAPTLADAASPARHHRHHSESKTGKVADSQLVQEGGTCHLAIRAPDSEEDTDVWVDGYKVEQWQLPDMPVSLGPHRIERRDATKHVLARRHVDCAIGGKQSIKIALH